MFPLEVSVGSEVFVIGIPVHIGGHGKLCLDGDGGLHQERQRSKGGPCAG